MENVRTKENIEKSKNNITFMITLYCNNNTVKYYESKKMPSISNGVATFNDIFRENRETIICGTFEIIKKINDNKE